MSLTAPQPFLQHHVWSLLPAWGPSTAAISLIFGMIESNENLVVTLVQHDLIAQKMLKEIDNYPAEFKERLSLVIVESTVIPDKLRMKKPPESFNIFSIAFDETAAGFIDALRARFSSRLGSWPRPTAIIMDMTNTAETLEAARAIMGPIPALAFHSVGATFRHALFAPFAEGGIRDYERAVEKIMSAAQKRGEELNRRTVTDAVLAAKNGDMELNGTVIKIPGLMPMYDYERDGDCVSRITRGSMCPLQANVDFSNACDGIILSSAPCLESAALNAISARVPTYPVGVLPPRRIWQWGGVILDEGPVKNFLDRKSKQSVWLITVGTTWYPGFRFDYLETMLETLLEATQPFLLVLAKGCRHGIPDELIEAIIESKHSMVIQGWFDQLGVLSHSAVGWHVTHAGWNSVCESLVCGLPIIAWPRMIGDQSVNAAWLSTRSQPFGLELLQMRTHHVGKPAYRNGHKPGDVGELRREILDTMRRCYGSEGAKIQASLRQIRRELFADKIGRSEAVVSELARL